MLKSLGQEHWDRAGLKSFQSSGKTNQLSRKKRKAGRQGAVPLLHLTAVQNDSWRLPRRHHGRADVVAAFQVQQHFIPALLLSIPLFFLLSFSSPSRRCSARPSAPVSACVCLTFLSLPQRSLAVLIAHLCLIDFPFDVPVQWKWRNDATRGGLCLKRNSSVAKPLLSFRDQSLCTLPACNCSKEVIELSPSWGTADYSLAHIRLYFHSG